MAASQSRSLLRLDRAADKLDDYLLHFSSLGVPRDTAMAVYDSLKSGLTDFPVRPMDRLSTLYGVDAEELSITVHDLSMKSLNWDPTNDQIDQASEGKAIETVEDLVLLLNRLSEQTGRQLPPQPGFDDGSRSCLGCRRKRGDSRTGFWPFAGRVHHLTPGEAADSSQREKAIASCLFTFVYFRSRTRRRFLLQFALIVINSGTDEIF